LIVLGAVENLFFIAPNMSYRIAIDLPCECDEYYGVVCGLHKWIRTLRDTIESATGLPIEEVLK
jgi:hypothetical protein